MISLALVAGVSLFCAGLSYRVLCIAGRHYRQTRAFLKRCAVVVGRVARLDSQTRRTRDGPTQEETLYYSVIEFQTQEGASSWLRIGGSTNPPYRVGDPVRVRYDRFDPSVASVDTFGRIWLNTLIPASLGVGLAAAAVACILLLLGALGHV